MKELDKGDADANEAIYTCILGVIQSGRLAPGQRLPEPAIARAIGISRERARRALHRLAHEGWLELVPNKGACLPEESELTLMKLFEARRAIEGAVVRQLAERPSAAFLGELALHLNEERKAAERGDRALQIALSRGFHEKLFEVIGNQWLAGFFRQVAPQTTTAYALQAPQQLPSCGGPCEHEAIFEAIKAGDRDAAERLMHSHLDEAMAHIRRFRKPPSEVSVEDVFLDSIRQPA